MYLIDTTAWLALFRGEDAGVAARFEEIIESGVEYGLTGMVCQEVLQEAGSRRSFRQMGDSLMTQRLYAPGDPFETHGQAARLFSRWRQVDEGRADGRYCLIAVIAMEHELRVLHDDPLFESLAAIEDGFRVEGPRGR